MSLSFQHGDYVPDGRGGLRTVEGNEALLERVLWKLSVRRGSFPLLPRLGSRLHQLGRVRAAQREVVARQYVAEALYDEPLQVTDVHLTQGERPHLTVTLEWQAQTLRVEMELGGME